MNPSKKKRPGAVLGLALDNGQLAGALVRVSGGSLTALHAFSSPLSLDPLTHEPELVGREIRNLLEAAGIRERRCTVCLPLHWALTVQTRLPEIPEADVPAFLEIEAERGFPYALDALLVSQSRFRSPGGDQYATQVAVPREHVVRLEAALKAAKLVPLSFCPGICAMQPAGEQSSEGVIALDLREESAGLQISFGGGVASLRVLEGAFEGEGGEKSIQPEQIAREIRITLGQLPSGLSALARRLRVFGRSDQARLLLEKFRPLAASMGLRAEQVETYAANEFRVPFPAGTAVSPALSLAARFLTRQDPGFEFLPPKISIWKQFGAKYSSKRLVYAGATVGGVAVIAAIAFLFQQVQLMNLQSKWDVRAPDVARIEKLQGQIHKYSPWFSEPDRALNVLREMTLAFPEDNSLTAKQIEIHDQRTITCTGVGLNRRALFDTLEKLRSVKDITGVQTPAIQGQSPISFSFSFHWGPMEGEEE